MSEDPFKKAIKQFFEEHLYDRNLTFCDIQNFVLAEYEKIQKQHGEEIEDWREAVNIIANIYHPDRVAEALEKLCICTWLILDGKKLKKKRLKPNHAKDSDSWFL